VLDELPAVLKRKMCLLLNQVSGILVYDLLFTNMPILAAKLLQMTFNDITHIAE